MGTLSGKRIRTSLQLLVVFALVSVSTAQIWDQKPFKQWSDLDLLKILTDSPWVAISMVGLRPSPPACAKDYPESSPIPELYPGQMPQEDRLRGILIF
jgi:hypothetical protein